MLQILINGSELAINWFSPKATIILHIIIIKILAFFAIITTTSPQLFLLKTQLRNPSANSKITVSD